MTTERRRDRLPPVQTDNGRVRIPPRTRAAIHLRRLAQQWYRNRLLKESATHES